jgi:multidrug efflux pump subunit AcrA (membrane-fusion protein)
VTKFIIGVVVAAILSSVLTYNFTVNNVTKNSDNELQKYAKKASLGKLIRSATAIGIVQPKVGAEVKVGSQISGIVKEIKVSIGDHVEK